MNSNRQNFWAAVALFALWAGLVLYTKSDTRDLIGAIKDALLGLGVFHATKAQIAPVLIAETNPQPPAPPAPTTKENLP